MKRTLSLLFAVVAICMSSVKAQETVALESFQGDGGVVSIVDNPATDAVCEAAQAIQFVINNDKIGANDYSSGLSLWLSDKDLTQYSAFEYKYYIPAGGTGNKFWIQFMNSGDWSTVKAIPFEPLTLGTWAVASISLEDTQDNTPDNLLKIVLNPDARTSDILFIAEPQFIPSNIGVPSISEVTLSDSKTELIITLSEDGVVASTLQASDFTVMADDQAVSIINATIDGTTITLTLQNAIDAGAAVSFSFTEGTLGKEDGTLVPSIAGMDVDNFSAKVLSIKHTGTAPEIDGEYDEVWNEIAFEAVNIVLESGEGTLSDTDLSASFKSMYDADNIYFMVEVTDDVLVECPESDLANSWKYDNIEMYFSAFNTKASSYLDGDNSLRLSVGQITSSLGGLQVKYVQTDTGYRYEVMLPFSGIHADLAAKANGDYKMGFEIKIADSDDADNRKNQIVWNNPSGEDNSWKQTDIFGSIQFTDQGTASDFYSNVEAMIYPNPVQNELRIDRLEQTQHSVKLFSMTGAEVYSSLVSGTSVKISCSDLPCGVYLLQVSNKMETFVKRIVKE